MGAEQSQPGPNDRDRNVVSFFINSVKYDVSMENESHIGPESLLVDFIRDRACLKGTKFMCREGGCGACIVTVTTMNPSSGLPMIRGVNSCLVPVFACDGWDIKTVEHVGRAGAGGQLHPIQQRMVDFSASQCGYCTSGWVMNMYSLIEGKKSMLAKDIEDSMDANICRCTGYRPILDAMKSLAMDASEELKRKCGDFNSNCSRACADQKKEIIFETGAQEIVSRQEYLDLRPLHLTFKSGQQWVKATNLETLFMAIDRFQSTGLNYRFVAGNTAKGVYKIEKPYKAFIEINCVPQLKRETVDPSLFALGGGVTLNDAIECLKKAGAMAEYNYCNEIHKHWKRVANNAVRHCATLAGNLMTKHVYKEFPSDIFTVLEAIGANLIIASNATMREMKTMEEFIRLNMMGKIILEIQFPKLRNHIFRSFKISRRFQNAHAYVNAGFLFQVDGEFKVNAKPRIVFGGISPNFIHATATETFFVGKSLSSDQDIQGAMSILDKEVTPEVKPLDAQPAYLKSLGQSLLYKFILGVLGDKAKVNLRSGGSEIVRGVSYGKHTYDTDKTEWPIYQPVTKIEAPIQCAGEAEYTADIVAGFNELSAAFVLTKVANAQLASVDPTEALQVPGVVSYVDAKDIPGENNYMTTHALPLEQVDVIFVVDKIEFAGQPIGIIVAETRDIALKAAALVKIKYSNVQQPILDIPTALEKARREGKLDQCTVKEIKSERALHLSGTHKISGEFQVGSQYHFPMEPQVVICTPRDDGMDVQASSQWVVQMQNSVADCLAIPANSVNVECRRVGGAFGAKLGRSSLVATACAVAANKLRRPVRFVVDIECMMSALGKRHPYLFKYDVEFDDIGKITNLNAPFYENLGATRNEPTSIAALLCIQSCYAAHNWQVTSGQVNTNMAPNTYVRAPGSTAAIGCIEYIMEQIAFTLKKDPMDVRVINLSEKGDAIFSVPGKVLEEDNKIPALLEDMETIADIEERKQFIENFNANNRWRKRALTIVPMSYALHYFFSGYNILIAIHPKDGTVSLSHSGIEMGQGINTKVVQVVAKELGISMDKIKVRPTSTFISPGGAMSASGSTSEHICYAALKACEELMERLEPWREKLKNPTWEILIEECYKGGIDLTASYNTSVNDKLESYDIWGLTAGEVEIDVLTGEYKIVRVDLMHDTGIPLSPEVDVGQIEGAFVMGLGLWLTEKLEFDKNTGELLTNRTWDYKPPMAKDIPEDFRVTLPRNSPNSKGVLRSKSTGESPLCMAVVVFLAIKQAIAAARADASNTDWFPMAAPATVEDIQQLCLTSPTQFTT